MSARVKAVNSNVVYFIADRNFLPLALANAGVLARQVQRNFDVVIFYEDSAPIPFQIPAGVEIISQALMRSVPDAAKGNAVFKRVSWAHLYAPVRAPGIVTGRGLYCDADTGVLRARRSRYSNWISAGHCSRLRPTRCCYLPGHYSGQVATSGVTDGRYANAGVLLIDVEAWCGNDITASDDLVLRPVRRDIRLTRISSIAPFRTIGSKISPLWNFLSILVPFGFDRMISTR